jgi:hypothetical protein
LISRTTRFSTPKAEKPKDRKAAVLTPDSKDAGQPRPDEQPGKAIRVGVNPLHAG